MPRARKDRGTLHTRPFAADLGLHTFCQTDWDKVAEFSGYTKGSAKEIFRQLMKKFETGGGLTRAHSGGVTKDSPAKKATPKTPKTPKKSAKGKVANARMQHERSEGDEVTPRKTKVKNEQLSQDGLSDAREGPVQPFRSSPPPYAPTQSRFSTTAEKAPFEPAYKDEAESGDDLSQVPEKEDVNDTEEDI